VFKGDSRAASYAPHLQDHRLAISFMTAAELFQWAAIRKWGPQRVSQLEASLKKYVVLPFDIELCRLWGEVRATCREAGQPISPQDAWVAATAILHDLPLVTHNPKDFGVLKELTIVTTVT
jgi:predicted nucleic acid-binding protein